MSKKSTKQPQKKADPAPPKKVKGGKGMMGPDTGKKFSRKYQPSPEAKRLGHLKKKKGHELAQAIMDLAFKGMKNSELKKAASEYYGVPEKDITVEMMMLFRQVEKSIQKADTNAFNAVMNRAHGLPKQKQEITGEGGVPLAVPEIKIYNSAPPLAGSEEEVESSDND